MFIFFRSNDKYRSNYVRTKKKTKKMLELKMNDLYDKLNDKNFSKFVEVIASPRRIFWRSFLSGIARGIGTAIGFSILGALLIYLLRYIVMLNLPVIGAFIKDIWDIVQSQ